ncbi:addiction module protein [Desulfobacula sp.]|uniref:addiction module protein n=1 Tax=Desulfobacula sp. TaxID=2593537 RepID=UPI002609FB8A|nr:addiction module protein [Desulfobacula sp.]
MIVQSNIEEITKNLISLSKKERLEIARFILFLDNRSLDTDIESVWENEIINRMSAVDKGTAVGIDFNKALKEIEKRFER